MRTVLALMLREIATSQGRVPGRYVWALAEPVAGIALLTAILSAFLPSPPLGRSFALFYAAGFLPFAAALDIAAKVGGALRFSRPLFGYPVLHWPAAIAARFLLNLLLHLVTFWLVIGALLLWTGEPAPVDPLGIFAGLIAMGLFGLGWGVFNAYAFDAFPLWERAWSTLTRPLFILSGLTFLPERLPPPFGGWLVLDPLVHGVGMVRAGLYAGYRAELANPAVLALAGLLPLVAGLALLLRGAERLIAET